MLVVDLLLDSWMEEGVVGEEEAAFVEGWGLLVVGVGVVEGVGGDGMGG